MQLSVANLDTFAENLERLVNQYQGYVAMREISGTVETSRGGNWRLRIPAGSLQRFLTELLRLGEVTHTQLESQDVTEQYYDLEARLKVAQAEEKRLLQLLDTATGKLSDILAVEKELNRVRIDVERMTGQLRRLTNLVEYSTVSLSARERQRYCPETNPDLWTRMKRATEDSWITLKGTGEDVLFLVEGVAMVTNGSGTRRLIMVSRTLVDAPMYSLADRAASPKNAPGSVDTPTSRVPWPKGFSQRWRIVAPQCGSASSVYHAL